VPQATPVGRPLSTTPVEPIWGTAGTDGTCASACPSLGWSFTYGQLGLLQPKVRVYNRAGRVGRGEQGKQEQGELTPCLRALACPKGWRFFAFSLSFFSVYSSQSEEKPTTHASRGSTRASMAWTQPRWDGKSRGKGAALGRGPHRLLLFLVVLFFVVISAHLPSGGASPLVLRWKTRAPPDRAGGHCLLPWLSREGQRCEYGSRKGQYARACTHCLQPRVAHPWNRSRLHWCS
jgi:hypothetical protein